MKKMLNIEFIFTWLTREYLRVYWITISELSSRSYGHWRWNGARQKRPMSSIVLQPGVKDMLLSDCKDFLVSEEWYVYKFYHYF